MSNSKTEAPSIAPSHLVQKDLLVATSFDHVQQVLTERGNLLNSKHASALRELMSLFASYTAGTKSGRVAFPLPTGMGKTTGIVSFVFALHKLGYRIPVAIAASQVQALVTLYDELLAAGVPESDIGLSHRDVSAVRPSTGCRPEDGRLIQLVTHARVRMGEDYLGLFSEYMGQQRPLLIYDETLFRSDSFALLATTLGAATHAFSKMSKDRTEAAPASTYLLSSVASIDSALEHGRSGDATGTLLELPEVHPEVLTAWRQVVAKVGLPKAYVDVLRQFLDVCQQPLRVLPMTQGGGAVAVRQAVSYQLKNVVILDASAPIRDLVSLDSTIRIDSFGANDLKSFEKVEVMQLLAAGGRSSIEQSFSERAKESSLVAREVVGIVKDEIERDPQRCVLVFTFKKSHRSELDIKEELRINLKQAGIDPDELVQRLDGPRPRVTFLHWGQHEGLNGFEYCQTVVLAGILHRAHLDIAASIKGQKMDLSAPTPHDLVTQVIRSEVCHVVYQAASRGSCRRVANGKAMPMRLWLIHFDAGLRDALTKVMPQAQWSYPEPRHLKKYTPGFVEVHMRAQILAELSTLPETTEKVSSTAIKCKMKLPQNAATSKAFSRAVSSLDISTHGWIAKDRSIVRGAAAYGFRNHKN